MRYTRGLAAVAWTVASIAASAWGASSNPVSPTLNQVQALSNQTGPFSGNQQLSTVESITNIPNGIEVRATFRVGVGTSDPFDPNFGQTFARISLQSCPNPHLDWSAFDGLKLNVEGTVGMFVQPLVQTGPSFQFFEPTGGGFGVGANSATDVVQDFNNSRTFSPAFMDPAVVANANDVGCWGIQIIGNGVVVGQPLSAVIRITTDNVPEPAALMLVGMAAAAGAAIRRRGA